MHTVGYLERVKLHLTCLHPGYQRHLKHLYRAQSRHARKKLLVSMVTCKMVGKVDRGKIDWSIVTVHFNTQSMASREPSLKVGTH